MGDDLSAVRRIEHFTYFGRAKSAKAAATDLERLGYAVTIARRWTTRVMVEATRPGPVDLASTDAFVREVFGCVSEHGGTYDGWGAMAVLPDEG